MLVDLNKNDYVEIMSKRLYMDCYSRNALEKIFEIEEELSEGQENRYALDGAAIRGTYAEYKTIESAVKDLGYASYEDLERGHSIYKLYDSVLITKF